MSYLRMRIKKARTISSSRGKSPLDCTSHSHCQSVLSSPVYLCFCFSLSVCYWYVSITKTYVFIGVGRSSGQQWRTVTVGI